LKFSWQKSTYIDHHVFDPGMPVGDKIPKLYHSQWQWYSSVSYSVRFWGIDQCKFVASSGHCMGTD